MTYRTHLDHKIWLTLSLTLGLLACCFASWRAGAREPRPLLSEHNPQQRALAGKAQALAGVLNADGTVKPGLAGSFDASGYRMEYTATGAHALSRQRLAWDTQFWLNNGVNGSVRASPTAVPT
ncbi:MAG: hypothetical protein HY011_24005 [Acidobacteria bacterium]|nr:hypothetical protein [Acidobacteriota bacterium]